MIVSSTRLLKSILELWRSSGKDLMLTQEPENEHQVSTTFESTKETQRDIDSHSPSISSSVPSYISWNASIDDSSDSVIHYAGATIISPSRNSVYAIESDIVGSGATGIVLRLSEERVLKVPRPFDHCKSDIKKEIAIYKVLGNHERVVTWYEYSEEGVCLEYMPCGSLQDYMLRDHVFIAIYTRIRWIVQITEAIQYVHSKGIIYSDISSRNFLLDRNLNLKICDFSGASCESYNSTSIEISRYRSPERNQHSLKEPSINSDLFALGSLIFEIETGTVPFDDILSDEVQSNYSNGIFPDTSQLICGPIIDLCWRHQYSTCDELMSHLINIIPDDVYD
ncbi:kinase-like domain-containing protein [Dipodascopsis uninucleata]